MPEDIFQQLAAIVGPNGILRGEEVYSRSVDPLTHVPNLARAIVRPGSTRELSAVMRCCHERGQTVVVQGGLTGVSGAAQATAADIAVSLERMNRIETVNPVTRTAVAQAGVTLQQLDEAAEAAGLFYPLDLGARGSATLGGTIATNAGGNRVVRWGMTRQLILGLEAVLADGSILSSMNSLLKNNTGYDLKQLFIGSEGTLGIVTRAVVRLVPWPESTDVALAGANKYGNVLRLLGSASALPTLSAFEVMWKNYYRLVTAAEPGNVPLPGNYEYYILVETKGQSQAQDRALLEALLEQALEGSIVEDAVIAQTGSQGRDLWKLREAGEIITRELSPLLAFDISLPVDSIEEYLQNLEMSLTTAFPRVRNVFFGHLGDSNIHIAVTTGDATRQHKQDIEQMVYQPLAVLGGSVSAEHGLGLTKKEYLPLCRTENEIRLMKSIKKILDPSGLLNPDVLFSD